MTKLSAAEDFAFQSPQTVEADIAQAWRDAGIETSAPTAEEIAVAELRAKLQRTLTESIVQAEALLESLRDQAIQTRCVLILTDSSMGVGRDGDILRLRPLRGDFAGVVKWTTAEARRHARLWNAGADVKADPRLQVEAVPLRQALRRLIDGQRQLLADLAEQD